MLGLAAGQFVATLSTTVIATALPTISGDLGGQSQLAWLASATLLAATIAGPLVGKLADVLGRRRVFLAAVVTYAVGAVVSGTSSATEQLLGGLAVQGVGIGGLLVMTQVLLADLTTPRERGRYVGYVAFGYGAAAVSGPLLGGFLVGLDWLGWRLCFFGTVPIAAIVGAVVSRQIPRSARRSHRTIDLLGMANLAAVITLFLILVNFAGREVAWTSPVTLVAVAGTLVCAAGLIRVERRAADPVLPGRLLRDRALRLCFAGSVLTSGTMYIALFLLPQFLQVARGVSPSRSGVLMLPLLLTQIAVTPLIGARLSRHGRWKPFVLAGTTSITVGVAILAVARGASADPALPVAMVFIGAGLGSTVQILMAVAQSNAHPEDVGVATSLVTFSRSLGASVGIAVIGAITNARLSSLLPRQLGNAGVPAAVVAETSSRVTGSPEAIAELPERIQLAVRGAYALAFHEAFAWALPVVACGPMIALLIRNTRLTQDREDHGDAGRSG
ncbi:MFS transporter [Nonomuraea wenchangensis]|uniref:MFS transporter n=1 Tax=Nonomuraea wenchangensis TaxID=568860 RepID=UPI003448D94A